MVGIDQHSHTETAPAQMAMARIRSALPSLPEAEQRVAEAFVQEAHTLVHLSLDVLAARIGVSQATVVRCCQSLGYRGVREFKLALAAETLPSGRIAHVAVALGDDAATIAGKILGFEMQAIADTRATLDLGAFARAVDVLLSATRIDLYATRSSKPVALDACYRFLRLGLPVTFVADSHMQSISAGHLTNRMAAFAISHSGRSTDTNVALQRAHKAGATCILLTSHASTPIEMHADIVLVTAPPLESPPAFSSRAAHFSVIYALSVALAMQHPEGMGEIDAAE